MKFVCLVLCTLSLFGQDVTLSFEADEAAAGLDLSAVLQLASEVETTEQLERALNDQRRGINNLDLDDDGNVDYIRVMSQSQDDVFVFILQVPLGEEDFQDVASIQMEQNGPDQIQLQVQGDINVYGPDIYVVPAASVQVRLFPLVQWTFSPRYHPWISPWRWTRHPLWWSPFKVVPLHVYRPHVTTYTHINVHISKVPHVHRSHTVYAHHSVSTKVVKKTHVSKTKVAHEGEHGHTTTVTHVKDDTGNRGTKVTHENSNTGRSQSVGVRHEADGDKAVKVEKSKTTDKGTKTKSVTKTKKKDGKTKKKKTKDPKKD